MLFPLTPTGDVSILRLFVIKRDAAVQSELHKNINLYHISDMSTISLNLYVRKDIKEIE
jgi:hypothetical protein